jgi:Zn-dependent protease
LIGGFTDLGLWIITAVFLLPAAAIAIPGHEIGHALAAYWQGDPSPRNRGFFRPQLRRFIEPYGLVAVFLANVGWGQPVPVNMNRLSTLRERLVYDFGGAIANLVVAVIFGTVLRLLVNAGAFPSPIIPNLLGLFAFAIYAIFFLNLSFAVFNLLPIPGLDGWRVVEDLFRRRNPRFFFEVSSRQREIWVGIVLVIVIASFLPPHVNLLAVVMAPLFEPLSLLLIGRCAVYISLAPCLL